ncbi:RNA polymerase subunit sigma-70 [Leifsonia sp. ZF2019]|uniref:RNA polymerase sigma factor n=1 Tax=Leifsonia sp. ZF2019 TaxID=2781978 RepID=UPI001CC06782|nr:DUF6596 domain-containing protein [Leifsonia sp. ZF2019]UAJ80705.1 RNA polymerase subunit sigma-70 [Leifsonia sp. ZF2019]
MTAADAREVAERTARASYGRLVAILAAPTRDLALAEDALADAFERALTTWPHRGIPDNPEGWLLTVARNRQRDVFTSAARRTSAPLEEGDGVIDIDAAFPDLDAIPDKRLQLLFVCAHPAIDVGIRTPLMLQTVLGLDAAQIARAFAVPSSAMAQRLVRAKRRIRDAGIPFTVPSRDQLGERLPAVLEAIYGAFAIDWDSTSETSLAGEALYLAVTLAALLGDEPEAFGLAALIALSSSRAAARELDGVFVPLDAQDPGLWDAGLIAEGEAYLRRAHELAQAAPLAGRRFQLEAAIQSAHVARYFGVETDWPAVRALTAALVEVSPTLGARVSLAAVTARLDGVAAGLAALRDIPTSFEPARRLRAALEEDASGA